MKDKFNLVGTSIADLEALPNSHGENEALSKYRGKHRVVIVLLRNKL
nr:hypothetical protein [Candidatus Sigynarchaeota archaeon]